MVWCTMDKWTFQLRCRGAKAVHVVGDFNNWSTRAHAMTKVGPDKWVLSLPLRPGEYRFRYLTDDGRWLTDYAAFGVIRNRLGGWDSVLYVPPGVGERVPQEALAAV